MDIIVETPKIAQFARLVRPLAEILNTVSVKRRQVHSIARGRRDRAVNYRHGGTAPFHPRHAVGGLSVLGYGSRHV